jgi:cytochrome c
MYRFAAFAIALGASLYPGIAAAADQDNMIAFNNHCRTCHSFKKDDNRLGPTMYGIYGAMAGQVKSYRGYSGSLSGIIWDEATLDKFMASPASVSTSTNMIFPPVADATERRKIIEFLKSISPR